MGEIGLQEGAGGKDVLVVEILGEDGLLARRVVDEGIFTFGAIAAPQTGPGDVVRAGPHPGIVGLVESGELEILPRGRFVGEHQGIVLQALDLFARRQACRLVLELTGEEKIHLLRILAQGAAKTEESAGVRILAIVVDAENIIVRRRVILYPELVIAPRCRFVDNAERIAILRLPQPVFQRSPFLPFVLVARIEIIAPVILTRRPVFRYQSAAEFIAALLGHHLDDAGLGVAVLGIKTAGDHLHLGDGQGVDVIFPGIVGFRAGAVGRHTGVGGQALHTIDLIVDLVGAPAADAVGAIGVLVDAG